MDAITAIMTRRSIRKYTDEPVDGKAIEIALRAAMAAPSAGNAQTWQFVVVLERETLKTVAGVHPYIKMAAQAQAGILVCGDLSREKYPGFWVQDCAACVQNMLLALHAQGLGAVWTGIYPETDRMERFRRLFVLPSQVVPMAFVPVGHPDQAAGPTDRYDPARVRRERW